MVLSSFPEIINQSNLYALQNNRHEFNLEKYQLKRFIGFLLFTVYHELPRERMYWETSEDSSVPLVREAFSKHKYTEIKRNIHLCDNNSIDKNDKMFKVRKYFDLLNKKNLNSERQKQPYQLMRKSVA